MSCCQKSVKQPPATAQTNLLRFNERFNNVTENLIKVVCVGESGVGKTLLLKRLADKYTDQNTISTIGVDTYDFKMEFGADQTLTVQLWDTAGQERYHAITKSYFMGAHLALVCFQLGDTLSFDKMKIWIDQLKASSEHRKGDDALRIVIIGTKWDLLTAEETEHVPRPTEDSRFIEFQYFETSSVANLGMEQLRRTFFTTGQIQQRNRQDRENRRAVESMNYQKPSILGPIAWD
jgi:Ras-related protein Rab-1A